MSSLLLRGHKIYQVPDVSASSAEAAAVASKKVIQSRFFEPWKLTNSTNNTTMEETCKAPDGSDMWTFGMDSKLVVMTVISIIAFTPITIILLGPKLVFYVGGIFGHYLKRKTAGRKAQMLELVEADEKEYAAEGERRDSDEWESVEAYATGTAKNGEKADKEWDGIVGFLHPFW